MKILLLGKNGQVGWELQRSLSPLGELIALESKSADLCGDLENTTGLVDTLQSVKPDIIVNAAAYTAVDRAEGEQDKVFRINAQAVRVLAEQAARLDALLVHYSSDYVFGEAGVHYQQEEEAVAPLNCYGASKAAGERAILEAGCRHLTFRTSWVHSAHGQNFAKTILRLSQERESLSVINDQFGAPTGADLLADVTAHAVLAVERRSELAGLYHVVAQGETTWFEYARFVLQQARAAGWALKVQPEDIRAIATSDYPTPARRPGNSRLCTEKLQNAFELNIPFWKDGVARTLAEVFERR